MKHIVIILLAFLLCKVACAQNYPETHKFINQIIIEKNIQYEDGVNREAINTMDDGLKNNRVFYKYHPYRVIYIDSAGVRLPMLRSKATPLVLNGRHRGMEQIVVDSIMLSGKEIVYARGEIKKMSAHKWSSNLFANAKMVKTDSIAAIIYNRKDNVLSDFLRTDMVKIYTASVPIYLRNETYCLFYHSYTYLYGDTGGMGSFDVYKKENGKWAYWGCITRWIT